MDRRRFLNLAVGAMAAVAMPPLAESSRTKIAIDGDDFRINNRLTYAGRYWQGERIEGLLMNARMVQGIFDDLNGKTCRRWQYPDTRAWDPLRNTHEFVAAMPDWREHGLLSFTINLQGGTPLSGARSQPWENSAFAPDGSLRAAYMERLRLILDRADEFGMAPIVGYFYVGQAHRLFDESAVRRAANNATGWLLERGYRNILIEIANETSGHYQHAILRPQRIHELIELVKTVETKGFRYRVGTSMPGGEIPPPNIVRVSDFLLLHGNGVKKPEVIVGMVQRTQRVQGYRPMPVVVNEGDHDDFEGRGSNMRATISAKASWGMLDQGKNDYANGYQCPPVNWSMNTDRKRKFFAAFKRITGV